MRRRWILLTNLLVILVTVVPALAGTVDVSGVIEGFMARQFPESRSHLWVVNGTQWQAENELVVDLNTIVVGRTGASPSENRFLLLIVAGKLAGAQNIPLDASTDCQPET